jgi:hypothetical protein
LISTGIAPPSGPLCSSLSVSRHPMRVLAQKKAAALQSLCVAPLLMACPLARLNRYFPTVAFAFMAESFSSDA